MTSDVYLDAPPPLIPAAQVLPRSWIGRRVWQSLTSMITLVMVGAAVIVGLSIGITAPEVSPVAPPAVGVEAGGAGLLDGLGDEFGDSPEVGFGDGVPTGGQGRFDGDRDGNGGRRGGRR